MRYSIVTPTICRQSLLRLCESIDDQTQRDWEHLVVIDMPRDHLTRRQRNILGRIPERLNRIFFYCDRRHKNYGHTCRHQVWEQAKGDYILYIDDDDYLADGDVLKELDCVIQPWGVFPILRHGQTLFNLPPRLRGTGTGMFMHKKDIGRWPDSDSYEADGSFVEELKRRYQYQVVGSRPLVVQPGSSFGVSNAESWLGEILAKKVSLWLRIRNSAKIRRFFSASGR